MITALPDLPELFEPFVYLLHFINFKLIIDFPALVFLFDQFAFGQNFHVLGNGLPGHVKMFGNSTGGHCLYCDQCDDGPSGGVGDGLENISSHVTVILWVDPFRSFPYHRQVFVPVVNNCPGDDSDQGKYDGQA